MLISLHELVQKYGIKFRGILHVGAHECEEIHDYERYIARDQVLWIEALSDKVELCKRLFSGIQIVHAVVSNRIEDVVFNVANNGQSSSILPFGLHAQYHPHVHYVTSFKCQTKLLQDILPHYNIDYNFVNLDIQGAELRALQGMEPYLQKVDYVYTEVNSAAVYKGCNVIEELDTYLLKFGLVRVETNWTEYQWGDAFYIRK